MNYALRKRAVEKICTLILLCALVLGLAAGVAGCNNGPNATSAATENPFQTFRDIPDITDDEIAAIEALQARGVTLIYATPHSTELFEDKDGTLGGYTVLFCGWLSEMIGVPIQVEAHGLPVVLAGLNSGEIDLATISATPERLAMYTMSDAIVQRVIRIFRYEGSQTLSEISQERLPRYAFIENSAMIELAEEALEPGSYEEVIVADEDGLYQAIKSGQADVFIFTDALAAAFDDYEGIHSEDFLPPIFLEAYAAAKNPDYDAVISVINKAMQSGAADYLSSLHRQGYQDYRIHKFRMSLDEDEMAYLQNTSSVPLAAQYFNYPIVFYDERNKKWDGITFDLLREVEVLTGLTFEVVNSERTEMAELIEMLGDGRAHIFSDLVFSPTRESHYIWGDYKYMEDQFALLSKTEHPNVATNEIANARVALIRNTAHAEMFRAWFPSAVNAVEYENSDAAFMALERGEADLVMAAMSKLLWYSNYYEFSGYKANYMFDYSYKSSFAYNKDQTVLRSLMDKALAVVDADRHVDQWLTKTYDHHARALQAQRPWLISALALSFVVIVLISIILFISRKASAKLKRSMAMLIEADERTKLMLDSAPVGITFVDRRFRVVDCNERALEMFGVADKDVFMANFHTYSPEYQPDGEKSATKRGRVFNGISDEKRNRFEWMHQKPSGEPLPCEVSWVTTTYKGNAASIGYIRDLSEVRAATKKIREIEVEKQTIEKAQKNLVEILDMMPTGVIIFSAEDFSMLYVNQTAIELFACQPIKDQMIGRSAYAFAAEIQPDGRRTVDIAQAALRLETSSEEILCNKLTGESFMARMSSVLMNYDGKPAMLSVLEDVTAEEEYRQTLQNAILREQEANQMKSQFVAHMSHEIRTPMNAILGIAEIELQKESIPADSKESLNRIYESGDLLLNIINDILDLSKIEAGKLEIIPNRYDIPSLINDAVQINRIRYESKPIEFFLEIDENTPLNLFGDEMRIRQILNNVLSNAYKYTDEGVVRLSVSAEEAGDNVTAPPEPQSLDMGADDDMGDVTLVLRVSDTGQGMTKEQIDKLFLEYTRFNVDANKTTAGTGLGMSITKHLLELMGGEVLVDSEPGKGTAFTVRIPQKRINGLVCGAGLAEKVQSFRFQSSAMAKRGRMLREYMPYGKILLVDDVGSNIYVATGMLLPYGLQVDSANSGAAAIQKIKEGNVYDIIFMDHMMPGMDGIEAVGILRGMGYKHSIVALTANALVGQADMFLENGFDGYISKPIDSRELNNILNRFIRDRKPPEVVAAARLKQKMKAEPRHMRGSGLLHGSASLRGGAPQRKSGGSSWKSGTDQSKVKKMFLLDAENALRVLDDFCGKPGGFGEAALDGYEIAVHGIKSALAIVEETELSEFANKLELAAIEKDLDLIKTETPKFIDELKALVERLET